MEERDRQRESHPGRCVILVIHVFQTFLFYFWRTSTCHHLVIAYITLQSLQLLKHIHDVTHSLTSR
jgi:hypothetical protein